MSSAGEKVKSGTAACSHGWPARWLCAGGVSRAQAASKGGEIAVGRGVRRVGGHEEQEGAGEATQSGGRAPYGTGGGKQRSRQEEEEKDWFANSENFRDPYVNQR